MDEDVDYVDLIRVLLQSLRPRFEWQQIEGFHQNPSGSYPVAHVQTA
jgi:hypothetical protein